MGFLSGVLGAVKNENEVTTYDKYIENNEKRLNKVIEKLNNKIGSGRTGLAESVGAVRGWLEGYGKKLDEKTKNVITHLKTLSENIDSNIISVTALRDFHSAASGWKSTVIGDLQGTLKDAVDAFGELDKDLQGTLQTDIKHIEVRINDFAGIAERDHEELRSLGSKVIEQLMELDSDTSEYVTKRGQVLINSMKKTFDDEIKLPMRILTRSLSDAYGALYSWGDVAMKVVDAATVKVDEILQEIGEGVEAREKQAVRQAAEALHQKAGVLLRAIKAAKLKLVQRVLGAQNVVRSMDYSLRTDLHKLKQKIVSEMKNHVKAQILEYIKTEVHEIKGTNGIEGITGKMQKYVQAFKDDAFEEKVKEWVKQILQENEAVKYWITQYVKYNESKGSLQSDYINVTRDGIKDEKAEEIAGIITGKIKDSVIAPSVKEFKELFQRIDAGGASKIQEHIEAVKGGLKSFVAQLGKYITEHSMNVGEIVTAVEGVLKSKSNIGEYGNYNLRSAIENIVAAVQSSASRIAEEMEAFTGDTAPMVGSCVDKALEKTTALLQNLLNATIDPPGSTFAHSSAPRVNLAEEIDKIADKVKEQLPDGGTDHDTKDTVDLLKADRSFVGYKTYIEPKVITSFFTIPPTGALPDAINEIEKQVNEDLDNIEDSNGHMITVEAIKGALALFQSQFRSFASIICVLVDHNGIPNGDGPNNKRGVKQLLRDLNEMCISKTAGGLYGVECDLAKILTKIDGILCKDSTHNLNKLIAAAGEFHKTTIATRVNQCVSKMTDFIHDQVNLRINLIMCDALSRYVNNAKQQLMELNTLVKNKIREFDVIIKKDLTTKMKGLMLTLSGVRVDSQRSKPNKLDALKSAVTGSDMDFATQFQVLSDKSERYLNSIVTYVWNDLGKATDSQTRDAHVSMVVKLRDSVYKLLTHLKNNFSKTSNFDLHFVNLHDELKMILEGLIPVEFGATSYPILDALKSGLTELANELDNTYVNKYSGANDITWEESRGSAGKRKLTVDGRKCAKVCLTIVPMLTDGLKELKDGLEDEGWQEYKIYNDSNSNHSLHRRFFTENGYDVGVSIGSKYGELNHNDECNGQRILGHLMHQSYKLFTSSSTQQRSLPATDDISVVEVEEGGRLSDLFSHLYNYFRVCHLGAPSKKHPCSVNEMLCWLTGLPHNGVYEKLRKHVKTLFEVPDENDPTKKNIEPINASPQRITHDNVNTVIEQVCAKSYALLTTFVGTGDEATYYACEFPNNTLGLQYPSNPADCLDTLLDILRRIIPPLKFLFMQCGQPASENGWLRCLYGKNVASSKWPCKEHSKSKSKCEAKCQPTCGPTCQPNCRPTSPLQSYLSDSLTGHLPHSLTSIGCRAECNTCPKGKPGMPCITPLGFRGFSGSTKTGSYLSAVIGDFLDIANIHTLFGLSPTTPKTLPEHFDFVSCLVRGWHNSTNKYRKVGVQEAFENSARSLSIKLYKQPHELTDALRYAYGDTKAAKVELIHKPPHATLATLSMITSNDPNQKAYCSPYMLPLCTNAYTCLPFKNSNTYLSWAIYLPWTFWDLLNNLYKAFCSINCQDWGCRGCLRGDKCKKGEHGSVNDVTKKCNCQCRSIVDCKGVAPTLYQFGFAFGEASTLNDKASPKRCSDFCSQLKNVLKSKYFEKLFEECDNFLWIIRQPFSYLVLALWLLSFLYLLHIMVIRLDLLHIKSHLHSPSSHRIAAQSLLAAARVNKLGKVFYLQP
ncbi:hypothetical protein, conserved [Babesia bigemina]|uniref:C3H1-type domain-containing protein n=1 Tax=Babesia bigemina TaxID=5866 RepID=A0A061BLM9_BABBI|nr:hypothetical protein, conserved [Babesia bigemina]CDR71781.1 hypothetical protein, conserved [Babesia bigemina]|eukprot:XP_012770725.1 hypothetical protein, conserved [Babesia bigemina]